MTAGSDALGDALDGKISVWKLYEVEDDVVAEVPPPANAPGVCASGEGCFQAEALTL